jgi:hypothetical protein
VNNSKIGLSFLISGAVLLCSGCVRVAKATYPDTWSAVPAASATPTTPAAPAIQTTASAPAAQCPKLAGRYTNLGEVAPSKAEYSACHHGAGRGEQCGESSLSKNIGDIGSGDWVELRQPDDDTLLIVSSDPTVAVEELHRKSGDFSCSSNGLERHVHASLASLGDNSNKTSVGAHAFNTFMTAGLAMTYAAGGVRTLTRRFSVASDGSVVMAVSQSETGVAFFVPFHTKDENLVRWVPAKAPIGDAESTPAAGAASPTDLPADHVGLFEPTNGKMWSKVKVTNLDGTAVNTYLGLPGVPVAMQPGMHWVQVGEHETHWMPLRDIDTKYAFQLEAIAGHRYRIADKLPLCLAPGNIDAALASSSVYHTHVSVIDEGPGSAAHNIDVEALCVSARTYVCETSDTPGWESSDGLQCISAAGWKQGYFGRDAGAVPAQ